MKIPLWTKITSIFLLAGLLFLSGCAAGGGRSGYYPPAYQQEEQDPYFWRMWQDQRGIGG